MSGHGAYISPSAIKISAFPGPLGGRYGGSEIFLPPFPPQNSVVRPPQNYVIMLALVSPTNPENLVMGWGPDFFVSPFENMGLLYENTGENPRERSQLLILLHKLVNSRTPSHSHRRILLVINGLARVLGAGSRQKKHLSPVGNAKCQHINQQSTPCMMAARRKRSRQKVHMTTK